MKNILADYKLQFLDNEKVLFYKKDGIAQDGTTPMYRDKDGTLWAITGHSHSGHIGMFRGTCVEDLKELYQIQLNFAVGHADFAFNGIRYPDGVKARGSVWPFGLYICPNTHRFFAFFHNESGWAGRGTAYDAFGLCKTPKYDSDFRHIGMMHSDDEGLTWTFDRWVLSGDNICFTEKYNPENDLAIGQKGDVISLGSGDFTFYVDEKEGFFYIFYNVIHVDLNLGVFADCHLYVARSRLRGDGTFGDFVKYYNGAFCEAGNFGRETPIVENAWHARVAYMEELGKYVLSYSPVNNDNPKKFISDVMAVRTGDNLISWSEPILVERDGKPWGNHYVAVCDSTKEGQPFIVKGNEFCILSNHNATDVLYSAVKLIKK